MMKRHGRYWAIVVALGVLWPVSGSAGESGFQTIRFWKKYYTARRHECWPAFVRLKKPQRRKIGERHYSLEGTRLIEKSQDVDTRTKIGVISAPKDSSRLTQENIAYFMKYFRRVGVDWLVVNGDVGYDATKIEALIWPMVNINAPVLFMVGNGESVPEFNDAVAKLMAKKKNVYNLNFTRLIEGDDAILVSVPGYYDPLYVYSEEGCVYKSRDLQRLRQLISGDERKPLVLVSHGPPRGRGKHAIDMVYQGAHVGDHNLGKLMDDLDIHIGIFGHILESGGRGTTRNHRVVKPGEWSDSLYVNAGSASAIPWQLLGGDKSYGMAMMVVIEGRRTQFEVLPSALQRLHDTGGKRR